MGASSVYYTDGPATGFTEYTQEVVDDSAFTSDPTRSGEAGLAEGLLSMVNTRIDPFRKAFQGLVLWGKAGFAGAAAGAFSPGPVLESLDDDRPFLFISPKKYHGCIWNGFEHSGGWEAQGRVRQTPNPLL